MKCSHCKGDTEIRNPKGYCDHLCYPDNCTICIKRAQKPTKFKVGQVIACRTQAFQSYKILKVYPKGMLIHKEPYYLFEGRGKHGSCESNLRGLTVRECGRTK